MIDINLLKQKISSELLEQLKKDINNKNYIFPSEINDCSRLIWFKLKHYPIDSDYKIFYPEVKLLGDLGNTFHEHFQEEANELIIHERNFILEELLMKGRIDAKDADTIYEIKTADTKTFFSLQEPLPKHLLQTLVYTIAFPNVKNICIIYINRNFKKYESDVKQFEYKDIYQDQKLLAMIAEIRKKINYIRDCYLNNKMPTEFLVKDSCVYCPYKFQCNENSTIKQQKGEQNG
jgi:hypothetical protein